MKKIILLLLSTLPIILCSCTVYHTKYPYEKTCYNYDLKGCNVEVNGFSFLGGIPAINQEFSNNEGDYDNVNIPTFAGGTGANKNFRQVIMSALEENRKAKLGAGTPHIVIEGEPIIANCNLVMTILKYTPLTICTLSFFNGIDYTAYCKAKIYDSNNNLLYTTKRSEGNVDYIGFYPYGPLTIFYWFLPQIIDINRKGAVISATHATRKCFDELENELASGRLDSYIPKKTKLSSDSQMQIK